MDLTVTTPLGTSATGSADQFTYESVPAVTALSPAAGPLGGATSVTISGYSFSDATAVSFGSVAATSYTVDSATEITAMAPSQGAGSVYVTVTTPVGTSATSADAAFSYQAAPSVTVLSPVAGPTAGGTARHSHR